MLTLEGHADDVKGIAFMGDGRLASASDDETARVWDLARGATLRTLEDHTGTVKAVDCVRIAGGWRVVTGSIDDTARVRDESGATLRTL